MDLRLKSVPYELDGKTYQLRCNMAVLMDVQEAFDGDLTRCTWMDRTGLMDTIADLIHASLQPDTAEPDADPEKNGATSQS